MSYLLIVVIASATFQVGAVDHNPKTVSDGNSYKRVCYFRPSKLKPSDVDPFICTHINFAFVLVKNCSIAPESKEDLQIIADIGKLKLWNRNLKLLLSVGGGGHARGFHEMVSTKSNRQRFITQSMQFVKKYKYDGLDIDWEFPVGQDRKLFTTLLKEYRNEISGKQFLLTVAVSSSCELYEVPLMSKYVDYANVMTYDFNSFHSRNTTAFNSPVYAEVSEEGTKYEYNNVNASIHSWLKAGMSPKQIIMGIPTYGRAYILSDPVKKYGFNAPACGDGGTFVFKKICMLPYHRKVREFFDKSSEVPYSYDIPTNATSDRLWYTYEGILSIVAKCIYINEMKIGGAMTWVLDSDDWEGYCELGQFPLHTVIKDILGRH
ncbi:Uncharacterised protein g9116 [Pycnogonum litorale]